MKKRTLIKLMNYWPPYLGAGIRITHISPDFTTMNVEMKLRFWNKNYVGTHYGGSLYSMCDPFFMLILMENLGPEYLVWDKEAQIRFKKPGRTRVKASFNIAKEWIESIRKEADNKLQVEPEFEVEITDKDNDIVAIVRKKLYVKKK